MFWTRNKKNSNILTDNLLINSMTWIQTENKNSTVKSMEAFLLWITMITYIAGNQSTKFSMISFYLRKIHLAFLREKMFLLKSYSVLENCMFCNAFCQRVSFVYKYVYAKWKVTNIKTSILANQLGDLFSISWKLSLRMFVYCTILHVSECMFTR